jgi:uncharacterized membrane protein required for colicin V production
MNWLDVVLALVFAGGVAAGYKQGLVRQALSLGAIVCGIILATYLQVPLAAWFAFILPETRGIIQETAAFWLLVVAITATLEAVQRRMVPATRLLAVGILDGIGGALVALPTVGLQMSVVALILRFLVEQSWPVGESLRLFVLQGMQSSTLVAGFYSLLLVIVQIVGALLPEGGPRLLGPV